MDSMSIVLIINRLIWRRCQGLALIGQGLHSKRFDVTVEDVAGGNKICEVWQDEEQACIPTLLDASQLSLIF